MKSVKNKIASRTRGYARDEVQGSVTSIVWCSVVYEFSDVIRETLRCTKEQVADEAYNLGGGYFVFGFE